MYLSSNFESFVIGARSYQALGVLMYIPHIIFVIYSYLTWDIFLVCRVSPLLTVLGLRPSNRSDSTRGILS